VSCQTCESQVHHNLYPLSIKLLEREPLRVVSHKGDMRGRTLCWLLERLDKRPYLAISPFSTVCSDFPE
jgi:hypothetical protein